MSKDEPNLKACAYASRTADLLRATRAKRDWLRKTTCPECKKEYWTNRETDYCFDCESVTPSEATLA
jgi:hypothetical protein